MVCECEKLEALFLKQHEDWNDSSSNVHVLYKTREFTFSRSVSKDDGGKAVRLYSESELFHWSFQQ